MMDPAQILKAGWARKHQHDIKLPAVIDKIREVLYKHAPSADHSTYDKMIKAIRDAVALRLEQSVCLTLPPWSPVITHSNCNR